MKSYIRVVVLGATALSAFTTYAQSELLVRTRSGSLSFLSKATLQATWQESIPQLNIIKVKYAGMNQEAAIKLLKSDSDVVYAEPVVRRYYHHVPNDPQVTHPGQYGLKQVKAIQAWDAFLGSSNMVIAVLDSGFRETHEDLRPIISRKIDIGTGSSDVTDNVGHGTHVGGTAAGATNNGKGVASVAYKAKLMAIKLGDVPFSDLSAKAIVFAADNGAKIISMSYGGPGSQAEGDAVTYAWSKGLVLFASAGNNNSSSIGFPAMFPEVIVVGATNSSDQKADFSNFGPDVDVAGPGDSVWSSSVTGDTKYEFKSGTSMACPYVASVAGLVWGRNPSITNQRLKDILYTTSDNVGNWVVKGRVNANRAVLAVAPFETFASSALSASIGVNGGTAEGTLISSFGSSALAAASIDKVDSSLFQVRSRNFNRIGNIASVDALLKVSPLASSLRNANIDVAVSAPSPVSALLYVYNYRTAGWEQAGSMGMSPTEKSVTVSLPLASLPNYLNSSGHVRVYLRAVQSSRVKNGEFTLSVNRLAVTGQYDPTSTP